MSNPYGQQRTLPLSGTQIVIAVSVLGIFAVVGLVFTLGWWAPNVAVWQGCGADQSFAILRGIFEKPDMVTCYALSH
jgi:hypothetical protein